MIQWLTLDRLEQLTEQFHQTYAVYFDLIAVTAVSLDKLQAIIPVAPVSNPHPSEPGLHECWYGCVDDFPFVITYYHHQSSDCYTTIRIFPSPPSQNRYLWSTLERLIPLPKPLLQRIVWLGYLTPPKHPVKSLYCWENPRLGGDPPYEVYRTQTAEEAEALLNFLTSLQPEYAYYIGEPSQSL
jgi:hypothetical protein